MLYEEKAKGGSFRDILRAHREMGKDPRAAYRAAARDTRAGKKPSDIKKPKGKS